MILLSGQTLTAKTWFTPESFQLQLGERDSSASLTIGPDAPEIVVGDWMQDDTEPGKGIVWRVRSVDQDYNTDTRTINLEHVIQTLKDTVMFGEITTDMLGGGNARAAAQYVLSRQSIWALGNFGYSKSAPFEFNSDNLMDALEEITSALPDAVWEYDFTSIPFKLHINQPNTAVQCEMRGGRNLSTLKKTIDRSRMYTRIYPIGADDLRISGNYIEQNTNLYGVICKVETDQAYSTEAQLRQWAQDRLRRHCEPTVTITINGLDLSEATGEPLDMLKIGSVCRVPVPELGTVIAEKITRLNWKDKVRDKEDVTVTLANNLEDVASIFKNESRTAAKAGRSGARIAGKADTKIEDTAAGLYTQIIRTAEQIRLEAGDTKRELMASIDVQADRIGLVVEGTGTNAKIKPASIVASINDSGDSSIALSAKYITLDGITKLNEIMTVTSGAVHISKPLMVDGGYADFNEIRIHGTRYAVTQANADYMIVAANVDGNTLTLTRANGTTVPFSKATSLSGAWSGGIFTVTAKQNGIQVNSLAEIITGTNINGTPTLNPSNNKYIDAEVEVKAKEQGESGSGNVVYTSTKSINASAAWQAGYNSAPGDTKTQRNDLYCTGATVQGGGYSNYTFSATLPTSRFSSGNTYTFWRVP